MKYIYMMIFMPILLMAENIDLLYDKVESSNIYKSKLEALNTSLQNKKANLYEDGWSLGAMGGYADVKDSSDGGSEYELSLGKGINLYSSDIDKLINESQNYYNLKAKTVASRLKVRLWQLYGNYCTTMDALQAKAELAYVYGEILKHIQKGVDYGEFDSSKAIMAKLSLENLNLQISKLENAVQNYESQIKVIVPFDGQFECRHIHPNLYKLFDPEYSALWPMLEKQVESSHTEVELSQKSLSSVNVNATYSNEIDTERYMVNLELPLNFGAKSEAKRAAAMSSAAAASYELESFRNSYRYESSALKSRLDIYTKYLSSTENSIKESANLLIKQSNMRFKAGEESFISMLKATETKLQMIETILELKIDRRNAVAKYMYKYAIDPNGVSK